MTKHANQLMERLVFERKERKISQKEMAERLQISQPMLSKMENRIFTPGADLINRYANALDLHLDLVNNSIIDADPEIYILKLYDIPLMKFSFTESKTNIQKISIVSAEKVNVSLLPADLELNPDSLMSWLRKRMIPRHRAFAPEILRSLGLYENDIKGMIDTSLGLSVNDAYWIVRSNFSGTFDQYNLYDHLPNETLSRTAFFNTYGHPSLCTLKPVLSPELTTHGCMPKAWRFVDGKYWLYKAGSFGKNYGREPYMEVFASKIGKAMGIPVVEYHLEKWDGKLASVCPLFTDKFTAYIPAGRLLKEGTMSAAAGLYASLGSDFYENFCSMVVFDALIANEDRHFGNFGFLVDSRTNTIQAPAPLFDHGMSLLYNIDKSQMATMDAVYEDSLGRWHCTGIDFFKLAQRYIGPVQKRQLDSMLHFTLPKEDCPLSKRYLSRLEKTIQKRARRLLELPCTRGAAGIPNGNNGKP